MQLRARLPDISGRLVPSLVNALARLPERVVLVLDDFGLGDDAGGAVPEHDQTHTPAIYRKLAVSTRPAAVTRARELGLL